MLICPVCRNQNLETAKFCGNCGNSFTRQSNSTPSSTSSLINCAQGHVYSAVYEHCPYCPQPQFESRDADFATRVETPITAVDPTRGNGPNTYARSQVTNDFSTRVDTRETMFETSETSSIPPPTPPPPAPTPAFVATEITPAVLQSEALGSGSAEPFRTSGAIESPAVSQERGDLSWRPNMASGPLDPPAESQEGWRPQTPAPTPQAVPPTLDRRTMVLSDQSAQSAQSAPLRKSKGRIIGWLVTYTHNPDGEDFRIYAGYNRIGANPVCDVLIEDETVSGSHAIIVYRDGRCLIKDDLSRNGTFVNGRELTEAQPLQSYDQVRVGNTHLTFIAAQRAE
jgi:Inner membrane component of T3SS, cytoplasmic domain